MIKNLSKPFKWFFRLEAASGLVLLIAAVIALYISNSIFSEFYFSSLKKYLFIGINDFGFKKISDSDKNNLLENTESMVESTENYINLLANK